MAATRHQRVALAVLVALAAVPGSALAQRSASGQTAGGAYYAIEVPALWNGDLVIWNHGTDMDDPAADPDLGPLALVHQAEGFAVAASSYRQRGWAVFKTVQDVRALVDVFESQFGVPERIFIYGGSLGGLVTAQLIEKANLGNVVGALLWCPAVGGSRLWDAGLDLRLVYDGVCGDVPGAEIPGGALGLPAASELDAEAIGEAVNVCTGVDEKPNRRTKAQKRRLTQINDALGGDESFLQTVMWFATEVMADLVHDKGKLRGRIGTDNADVVYPDPDIDETIERVTARRGTKRRLTKNYTPSGKIGDTRIVALHTDKDGLVFVENVGDYRDKLPADQLVAAVAVESEGSHCGFSIAEGLASWESLLSWANGAPRPTVDDVQELCALLAATGIAAGPCRIDPDFEIGTLDDRILAR